MKKYAVIILAIIILAAAGLIYYSNYVRGRGTSLVAQSNTEETRDVREVVWGQLSSNRKERIDGTWRDGKASKITFKTGMGMVEDTSYEGKIVYMIDYPAKNDSGSQNVVVYADTDTFKYIGYGFTD